MYNTCCRQAIFYTLVLLNSILCGKVIFIDIMTNWAKILFFTFGIHNTQLHLSTPLRQHSVYAQEYRLIDLLTNHFIESGEIGSLSIPTGRIHQSRNTVLSTDVKWPCFSTCGVDCWCCGGGGVTALKSDPLRRNSVTTDADCPGMILTSAHLKNVTFSLSSLEQLLTFLLRS